MSYISEKANVYDTAEIGENVSIGAFAEIGNKVKIGNNVKIGCGAFIPENVIIEDDVFIGPHVVFTNDKYPPSNGAWRENSPTIVKSGIGIGANSTILPSLIISGNVGAGSVVTKNVPKGAVVYGNPAKDPNLTTYNVEKNPFDTPFTKTVIVEEEKPLSLIDSEVIEGNFPKLKKG